MSDDVMVPDVIETDTAITTPRTEGEIDYERALVQFENRQKLLQRLIPASIKATRPQDWVKHGDKNYMQGTGADRVAPLWGIEFDVPTITQINHDDGHVEFVVEGGARCNLTRCGFASVVGGRSSRDKFFWPGLDDEGRIKAGDRRGEYFDPKRDIDVSDVRKAAWENWKVRCVAMLTGLRNLTDEDLGGAGVKAGTAVRYEKGGRGGETTPADLKAAQVALGNEILERVGGDKDAARDLCMELTEYTGKNGKKGSFDSPSKLRFDWQIKQAHEKLREHPKYGDSPDPEQF